MACFVLWVQFKTKLGKQMHEVDLNTWIASIDRQVTFCCAMLRIQQITKLHLPSWEMGISWEAFSFLVLSFISSSYDVFFAISEIKQIFFWNCQLCGQKQCIKFFLSKVRVSKTHPSLTPLSPPLAWLSLTYDSSGCGRHRRRALLTHLSCTPLPPAPMFASVKQGVLWPWPPSCGHCGSRLTGLGRGGRL